MRSSKVFLFLSAFLAAVATAAAAPVVTYTVSGTSGNYTLDFSVTNNLTGTDQDIYLFGVLLSAPNVVGSPSSFDPTVFSTWTNSGYGGSSLLYNNVWLDGSESDLMPGQTLSGFDVQVSDATAPQAVPWFAFAASVSGLDAYGGSDYFGGDPTNPGFEGVASPEPASWLLLIAGVGAFALLRLKTKIVTAAC